MVFTINMVNWIHKWDERYQLKFLVCIIDFLQANLRTNILSSFSISQHIQPLKSLPSKHSVPNVSTMAVNRGTQSPDLNEMPFFPGLYVPYSFNYRALHPPLSSPSLPPLVVSSFTDLLTLVLSVYHRCLKGFKYGLLADQSKSLDSFCLKEIVG